MPIDLQRILEAAVTAAVAPPGQAAPATRKTKKRRLSTGRAMLLGAGLATAGRAVAGHKGRDMLSRVQQRIADSELLGGAEPEEGADVDGYEDELEGYEPEIEDEEVEDDSLDEDQEPEADPDDEAEEPEPRRPRARRSRQRGRA